MTNTATLNTSNKNTNNCGKLKYTLRTKNKQTINGLNLRSIRNQQSKTNTNLKREREAERGGGGVGGGGGVRRAASGERAPRVRRAELPARSRDSDCGLPRSEGRSPAGDEGGNGARPTSDTPF